MILKAGIILFQPLLSPQKSHWEPLAPMYMPTLDLEKASATIISSRDTVTIRALAQRNVFLIENKDDVTMGAFNHSWTLPAPVFSESGGVKLMKRNLPPDPDYKGMDVYIALGSSGKQKAISIVTSREDVNASVTAPQLVNITLNEEVAKTMLRS